MSRSLAYCEFCNEEWPEDMLEDWKGVSCPACGPRLRQAIAQLYELLEKAGGLDLLESEESQDETPN